VTQRTGIPGLSDEEPQPRGPSQAFPAVGVVGKVAAGAHGGDPDSRGRLPGPQRLLPEPQGVQGLAGGGEAGRSLQGAVLVSLRTADLGARKGEGVQGAVAQQFFHSGVRRGLGPL
jgi:hypothetical protein